MSAAVSLLALVMMTLTTLAAAAIVPDGHAVCSALHGLICARARSSGAGRREKNRVVHCGPPRDGGVRRAMTSVAPQSAISRRVHRMCG